MSFDVDTLSDEAKEYVAGLTAAHDAAIAELTDTPAELPEGLPDAVTKRLDEQAEAIAKAQAETDRVSKENAALVDQMATEKYTERAKALATLVGDPDDVAPVLKALATGAPEAFAKLDTQFDTLLSLDGFAKVLTEYGDSAADGSALDQITAHATEIRKNDPTLSPAEARKQAWTEHPELKTLSREEGS